MAQKKPASHSGAKKRKKPDTAAKRAVEREPTQIPVRQILAGACFLLAVLALSPAWASRASFSPV